MPERIPVHDEADFAAMRRAGAVCATVLDRIGEAVVAGISTDELDRIACRHIEDVGARPAPLGYRGFPKGTCISVNQVVCHGIPGPLLLRDGDILNIDVTVVVDGWHGDSSRMYWAGRPNAAAAHLCRVTFEAMWCGIRAARPGATLGDIGHAIQYHAEAADCSVVRDYCGHGIGRTFHAPPKVLHWGRPGRGPVLEPGMFFTIEPMINLGRAATRLLDDRWTVVTADNSLSAQFEHTIGITETGAETFTLSPAGRHHPDWS
jgi:methionyl aminopeptidase